MAVAPLPLAIDPLDLTTENQGLGFQARQTKSQNVMQAEADSVIRAVLRGDDLAVFAADRINEECLIMLCQHGHAERGELRLEPALELFDRFLEIVAGGSDLLLDEFRTLL